MDKREDLFAAAPPLEALTMLLSMAMTEGIGYERGRGEEEEGLKLAAIYIKRAYLQADARRGVCGTTEKPDAEEGTRARLTNAMFGTRNAAQSWELTYREANGCGESITLCDVSSRARNQIGCARGRFHSFGKMTRSWIGITHRPPPVVKQR